MRQFNDPFLPDKYYHVFNRAVGNEQMFNEPENYRYFLEKLKDHILCIADIFFYSFLPNHFHLFVRIKPQNVIEEKFQLSKIKAQQQKYDINRSLFISEQFGNWCNGYTKAFNKRYNRKGKLFMDNLNRRLIDSDAYYSKIIHYIHVNAVQHKLCRDVESWPYSSYHSIINNKVLWLAVNEVLEWFGGINNFIQFHKQPIKPRGFSKPSGFDHLQ
ncbi:transposase [Parafilimonas sp.]|uniref:transposase n=1 Tax=Parafilimonas sp. TaxID=1969739 RepID=UPI003F80B2F2